MHTIPTEHADLSIVIPCYNGFDVLAANLPAWLQQLDSYQIRYKVIVVNDGSTNTKSIEELGHIHALEVIGYTENRGKGYAVKTGFLHADTPLIMFTDADLPYDPAVVPDMIRYASDKEFDLVSGDRTLRASSYYGSISRRRSIGSRLFSRFVGSFVAGGLYDTQCGIKLMRKQAAHQLFKATIIRGFAFDVELFYLALKLNMDIKRVPVQLKNNDGSSVWMMRDAPRMVVDVMRMILNYYRGGYSALFNG